MNKYPGDPTRGVDEWKKIMNSFGVGEFLNNDLAVGSKGRIPSGEFYEKRSGTKTGSPILPETELYSMVWGRETFYLLRFRWPMLLLQLPTKAGI